MSSIALSSTISNLSNASQAAATDKAASTRTASTATTTQASGSLRDDTVKLSIAAQAKMMHRQGLSASVIAASLGTNVASIDGYLNIKVATQTATTMSTTSTPAATTETASSGATGSSATTQAATIAAAVTAKG